MLLTWLALALATLQKGIVALAMPGFALVLYSLVARDPGLWRRLRLGTGLAIVLALNLPWWMLMTGRNPQFPQFFFVHEHFTRFATTEHARSEPWFYLPAVLVAGILPWLAPTVRGVFAGWGEPPPAEASRVRAGRFLVIWAAAVILFYAPSGSKLAPYILPMMPPLALLAGRHLASSDGRALRSTLAIAALLTVALLLAGPLVPHFIGAGLKRDVYLAVGRWLSAAGVVAGIATLAAAWLSRGVAGMRGGSAADGLATSMLGVGLVASFALLTCGTNALEPWRGGPGIASQIAPYLNADMPFYCVGFYPQTLPFALRRTCTAVGYHGELEIQFDQGGQHFLPTYAAFLEAWRRAPQALAVVEPLAWAGLQAQGIPATIVARDPTMLVIVKPPIPGSAPRT
jgi:4-amino-4-deoxy-L-arabinose transferase-like glycosyltransferase